jgi:hypothetical protein
LFFHFPVLKGRTLAGRPADPMPLRLSAFIGRVIVGNKNTSPRVIVFELSLINSSAFRDLNRAALIVLLGFYGKRRMVNPIDQSVSPHGSSRITVRSPTLTKKPKDRAFRARPSHVL